MRNEFCLKQLCTLSIFLIFARLVVAQEQTEAHRPFIHFTPEKSWMNDPNGMVFHKGVYHLFYQYYPDGTVWGPMHWGHATSKDLVHWERLPIALYPDSIGMIFSGSAVVDKNNTSGFGKNGQIPLVAIFTSHNSEEEKKGSNSFENQSLAYSVDDGKTWTKYAGNPVLRSPGIRDFRDPKVFWHQATSKWIMTLAAVDKVIFYSSPDLKTWNRETDFGASAGAHGGVWECPDLFPLKNNAGKNVWVLIVNINPGGPNKGSATQYFLGDFDGKSFRPISTKTKWLDYGPDEYAGITWSNTGERKIFIGWMSNWLYANKVPTVRWRSATTIARELKLLNSGGEYYLASSPVKELSAIEVGDIKSINLALGSDKSMDLKIPCRIKMDMNVAEDFSLKIGNSAGEEIIIGFDKTANQFYIDRSKSGKVSFQSEFAGRHVAPRISTSSKMKIDLIVDVSSVELFADDGMTVMTSIFFPEKNYDKISLGTKTLPGGLSVKYLGLKGIW